MVRRQIPRKILRHLILKFTGLRLRRGWRLATIGTDVAKGNNSPPKVNER